MSEKHVQAVENMEFRDSVAADGTKVSGDILRLVLMTMAEAADDDGVYGDYTMRDVVMCPDGKYRFVGWESGKLGMPVAEGRC